MINYAFQTARPIRNSSFFSIYLYAIESVEFCRMWIRQTLADYITQWPEMRWELMIVFRNADEIYKKYKKQKQNKQNFFLGRT